MDAYSALTAEPSQFRHATLVPASAPNLLVSNGCSGIRWSQIINGSCGLAVLPFHYGVLVPGRLGLDASVARSRLAGHSAKASWTTGRSRRMPQQPDSPLTPFPATPAQLSGPPSPSVENSQGGSPAAAHPHHHVPRWLQRIELFLRVMLRLYIGLAVCYTPWSQGFWDQNPIFLQYPWLGRIATTGAVRGLVSGLGLLNLWIAFQDVIRHRDG